MVGKTGFASYLGMAVIALAVLIVSSDPGGAEERTSENDARLKRILERRPAADANNDGVLTFAEMREYRQKMRDNAADRKDDNAVKPDHADVQYGDDPAMVLDIYLAESDKPTPLVMYIHGGGFHNGDKADGKAAQGSRVYTKAGISFASINYRMFPAIKFPAPMLDGARAVQFIRSKAEEWNIDPDRIGLTGGSAGAGISLWVAFHDDLADPESEDPVARFSTRITCAAVLNGQTSYDARFAEKIGLTRFKNNFAVKAINELDEEGNVPPEMYEILEETAPINHLSSDDPPVFLQYNQGIDGKDHVHHPKFGLALKEKADKLGTVCIVKYNDMPEDPDRPEWAESVYSFLMHCFDME